MLNQKPLFYVFLGKAFVPILVSTVPINQTRTQWCMHWGITATLPASPGSRFWQNFWILDMTRMKNILKLSLMSNYLLVDVRFSFHTIVKLKFYFESGPDFIAHIYMHSEVLIPSVVIMWLLYRKLTENSKCISSIPNIKYAVKSHVFSQGDKVYIIWRKTTITLRPILLRWSCSGSEAHLKKTQTSLASWLKVAGVPVKKSQKIVGRNIKFSKITKIWDLTTTSHIMVSETMHRTMS